MKEVRVTCRNQEEFSEIIEIARKEGYRWIGGSELSGFKPTCNYPYDIIFRNYLTYTERGSRNNQKRNQDIMWQRR